VGGEPELSGRITKFSARHESIQTTGDVYTDWDIDQLAETLLEVVDDD
jgi:hypothetical protein